MFKLLFHPPPGGWMFLILYHFFHTWSCGKGLVTAELAKRACEQAPPTTGTCWTLTQLARLQCQNSLFTKSIIWMWYMVLTVISQRVKDWTCVAPHLSPCHTRLELKEQHIDHITASLCIFTYPHTPGCSDQDMQETVNACFFFNLVINRIIWDCCNVWAQLRGAEWRNLMLIFC